MKISSGTFSVEDPADQQLAATLGKSYRAIGVSGCWDLGFWGLDMGLRVRWEVMSRVATESYPKL